MKSVNVRWLGSNPKTKVGTTWGTPWAEGELLRDDKLSLTSDRGESIALQSWNTAYWPDGSIKWSAHAATIGSGEKFVVSKGHTEFAKSKLKVQESDGMIEVSTGQMVCSINKSGNAMIHSIYKGDKQVCVGSKLIMIRQNEEGSFGNRTFKEEYLESNILNATIESAGEVRVTIKIEGVHKAIEGCKELFPFVIRLYFYEGIEYIKMMHTFVYDGDVNTDFIKGIGIEFSVPMSGEIYNRHIRLAGDKGLFSEPCQSISYRYKTYNETYKKQIAGVMMPVKVEETDKMIQDMAVWNDFKITQYASDYYKISKRTHEGCSWLPAEQGKRSKGLVYAGCENGGLAIGMKNFWQKNPSSLEINNMSKDRAAIKVWFWSPDFEPMDMRHYDTETHTVSSYEGAVKLRSTPVGVANTNEVYVWVMDGIADNNTLLEYADEKENPALLVCEPEHYHDVKAFGVWSLKDTSTPSKAYIEELLDNGIKFYMDEIEQRRWYGLWHFGDVMHTYDMARHKWKYDVGGFAWQNTELVPNMWLWLSFLRTGREDIFRMAEAMARHTSEVDIYHAGEFTGLGSRHNVIHWGCGCKEGRIAMAGLHRYFYYLTADERIGDIFEIVKDADYATIANDPMWEYFPKGKLPTHARSGPDWTAFASNWMTRWERFEDEGYRDKLKVGIECLKNMQYRLRSGTAFEYDPHSGRLESFAEGTAGYHLAICMGEPEVWIEISQLLKDDVWDDMIVEVGEFYYLSMEEKIKRTGPDIVKNWDWPMFATGIAAYAAYKKQDDVLAKKVWNILMENPAATLPYKTGTVDTPYITKPLEELENITTNTMSQWALNAIVCLELIGDQIDIK